MKPFEIALFDMIGSCALGLLGMAVLGIAAAALLL